MREKRLKNPEKSLADEDFLDDAHSERTQLDSSRNGAGFISAIGCCIVRLDPGAHRRVKGLRLVTAYGLAVALGSLQDVTHRLSDAAMVSSLAGGFALWASVSEAQSTRSKSSRDLTLLCGVAALSAILFAAFSPILENVGRTGSELMLVSGAFCVGYFKRFGVLGAGIGSQIFIGQLLAYGPRLRPADLPAIAVAGLIASLASTVPRLLSGPAELPATMISSVPKIAPNRLGWSAELIMGIQAAAGSLSIVAMNELVGLEESAWAITACAYVVANSVGGTAQRVRRRIAGTLIGVPLGLLCVPLVSNAPVVIWAAAALAMIIYSMALPDRYDVACAAFAFALIVTLAVSGPHPLALLVARAWETILGGALGLAAASFILPLRPLKTESHSNT